MPDTFVKQFFEQLSVETQSLALVIIDESGAEHPFTKEQFLLAVQRQACHLKAQEIQAGDIVLLVLPHGLDLFSSIWGVLAMGAIPIVYSYRNPLQSQAAYIGHVREFADVVQPAAILVESGLYDEYTQKVRHAKFRVIEVDQGREDQVITDDLIQTDIPDLNHAALIQFSSGTTGAKKGVVLSYQAMQNYLEEAVVSLRLDHNDVFVSWLPLYHDMGLIACFMLPLVNGLPVILMSPTYWISHPVSLLQNISKYRGTISLMPNFAFIYSAKSIQIRDLADVDLSSWRMVINGAELVNYQDMQLFLERFSRFGLRPSALSVGYGMAECVLGVSRTPLGEIPKVDWVSRKGLLEDGVAVPCNPEEPDARMVASCGRPHPMVNMEIVDANGLPLPERRVGEVKIRSTTLFREYYRQPVLTAEKLVDGWFYTGDLGYLFAGELYICGRKKDIIIVHGRNVYPEDIENSANAFKQIRNGRSVAFGIPDRDSGTERIVLVCELRQPIDILRKEQLANELRNRIWDTLDILVSKVEFVEKGWVVKTTSGKLARSANKEKYLASRSL